MNAEEKSFEELVEDSINLPDKGKVFKGRVVSIDNEYVFVDFGFKSEGIVPVDEFYGKEGELKVKVGDEVEVMLERWGSRGELPRLSKKRVDLIKEWERIQQVYQRGKAVSARILEKVKGGLIADIGDSVQIKAFIPSSQLDLRPQGNLDKFVGKVVEAKIIKLSDNSIVLSRRSLLEEQREIERKKILSSLKEGKTVTGNVVKLIDQGVFVDLGGGVEGFIPISELSWGRIKHPSNVVSQGEEIRAKVIKLENDKITLSLKQTKPDPWSLAAKKYKPGIRVRGKVVSVTNFGVFVELEPGVEGLVHSSELTWTKRFRHPKEIVSVGTRVEAVVLEVDADKRRIALSLKQIEQSPWELFKEKNPPGTVVKGKVKEVTDRGIFVEVQEELVGLVHSSDISWTGKVNTAEEFKAGDEINVVVLNVDTKNKKIKLGIKQLTEDPWEKALKNWKAGETILTGKVTEVGDRKVILELENGIEGIIKASEFTREGNRDIARIVKPGDSVTAQIVGFDNKKRQVILSKKKYEEWVEKERVSSFLSSQGEASVKLGDVVGDKLKSLVKG
ncbi:MAG: 30S ribosomal protein S1 [Deltaproteobacteria bacterium]|jgi:small subunit ribosomal protein S1|nr:MAG: 30S ribosomal protein S1 [Deltaproteobacteria bacterium]